MQQLNDQVKTLEDLKKAIDISDFGTQFGQALTSLEVLAGEVNKKFGQTRERIYEIRTAAADSIPKITRLGGDIVSIQEQIIAISDASKRNTIATTEQMEKMFATSKVTGIETKALAENFLKAGYGLNSLGKEMESIVNYTRSIGGNVREISSSVVGNLDLLNRFSFEKGVVGLTKMAAQSSMLRFDMSETLNFANKVMNPEGAISMAAAFQRLGVAAGNLVDPFALMNQSINDPSGLQDSLINIGKQFTEFNKESGKFEISREGVLRLTEIEKEAGMAAGTLSKAGLAAAELDARVSQISPAIKFKNEEDKQYLANLGRLGEKGQYEVELTPGSGLYTNLSELNQDQIDKLIEQQKRAPKSMEDIARAQMRFDELAAADLETIKNTLLYGAASAIQMQKGMEKLTAGERIIGGGVTEKLETKDVRGEVEKFGNTLTELVENFVSTGKLEGLEKASLELETQMKNIGPKFTNSMREMVDKAKTEISGDSADERAVRQFLQKIDSKISSQEKTSTQTQTVSPNIVRGKNYAKTQEISRMKQEVETDKNVSVTHKVEMTPWNINVSGVNGELAKYFTDAFNSTAIQNNFASRMMDTIIQQQGGRYAPGTGPVVYKT